MFEKLVNFRDLGGIPTKDGKKIKPNMLFRSGELAGISARDVTKLQEMGLSTIVDMRTATEVNESPNEEIPGTKTFHIDFFAASNAMVGASNDSGEAPSQENMFKHMATVDVDGYMENIYKDIIENEHAQNGFREFFRIATEEKPAILWHCYAGKDRTGVSGALLLTALGVSKEEIMKDYLLTNELRKNANDTMVKELKAKGMPDEMSENIEAMMYVKDIYLETAYNAMETLAGTAEAYIQNILGVTSQQIEALHIEYLV